MYSSQRVLTVLLVICLPVHTLASSYYLSSAGLVTLPNDIPLDATAVDLPYNLLTSLGDNALSRYTLLQRLNLYDNDVTSVSTTAFAGTQLEFLYMTKNALLCIPPIQPVASTLRILDVQYNTIQIIMPDDFLGMTALTTIQLIGNPLTKIADIVPLLPALVSFQVSSFWCCEVAWIQDNSPLVYVANAAPCVAPASLVGTAWTSISRAELDKACETTPSTVCGKDTTRNAPSCGKNLHTSHVHVHRDQRLLGSSLLTLRAVSRIDCAQMCLQLPACKSANYATARSSCETNAADISSSGDLVNASGYEFLGSLSC